MDPLIRIAAILGDAENPDEVVRIYEKAGVKQASVARLTGSDYLQHVGIISRRYASRTKEELLELSALADVANAVKPFL